MNILVILVFLLAIAVVVALAVLRGKQPQKSEKLLFESKAPLFSPAERSFLGVLEQAVGSRYRVFGKVRLGDIVKPAKGLTKSKATTGHNKINQKHVDFVVCAASDLAVFGVIELDDKSHERGDRVERDNLVDQALGGAKIPIVHFSAKRAYPVQEVRRELVNKFRIRVEATEQPQPSNPILPVAPAPVSKQEPLEPVNEAPPLCPKCTDRMVKRQAKTGSHAGKWFWACTAFPKCRQVISIEREMA